MLAWKSLHRRNFLQEAVGGVVHPGDDDELAWHACGLEPLGVVDILVEEHLQVADPDPRRSQSGHVGAPGGRRILGSVRSSWLASEVRGPSPLVGLRRPRQLTAACEVITQCGAVVEHRRNQRLGAQRDALVKRALCDRGCETAARTRSVHGDAVRVDAQYTCLFDHPPQAAHTIVKPCGKGVFGCEPIVRRHHDGTQFPGQPSGRLDLQLRGARAHPAAMQRQHSGPRCSGLRRCHHQDLDRLVSDAVLRQRHTRPWAGLQAHQQADERQHHRIHRDGGDEHLRGP